MDNSEIASTVARLKRHLDDLKERLMLTASAIKQVESEIARVSAMANIADSKQGDEP